METWPSGKAMRPALRMVAIDKLKVGERETSAEVQHDRAFPPKTCAMVMIEGMAAVAGTSPGTSRALARVLPSGAHTFSQGGVCGTESWQTVARNDRGVTQGNAPSVQVGLVAHA